MSGNYASELIGIQNQNQNVEGYGPGGFYSDPKSIYSQLQQSFKNSLESAANQRANQALELNERSTQFNEDLAAQKFDIYKRLQDQMQPIQVRQANIDADLQQTQLDAAPYLQDAKKQAAIKQINSQSQISQFGAQLQSMEYQKFQDGGGDALLESLAPSMTHSDYLQAQDILNQKKATTGVAAAQAARAKNITDQMSLAPALGYNDINDPQFQQAYRNFKQQELTSPEGAMIRRDPKTGVITMSRPASTFSGGKPKPGSPEDFLAKKDQAKTLAELIKAAYTAGDQKRVEKLWPKYENLISGQPSGGTSVTPQVNSVLDNLQ